ncbi:HD domain-containing phosphohydrolase [Sulfuricurvum sp.]|uniref:HD-GYP domain-containing protein n=1 Tax=Sulfuricurvum sp. TaxID=2025608 RepID=UPI00286D81B4|nr:HD domain-containing phosphohydrolase [Sulfuricurvum sp.]
MKQVRISRRYDETPHEVYVEIEKWLLDVGDILPFDLFSTDDKFSDKSFFLAQNTPISSNDKTKIERIRSLYIRQSDLPSYNRFVDKLVQAVARNEQIPITKKAAVIYRQASVILDEMFENPEELENVPKSKKVVNTFVNTIFSDTHAIESMIKITAYDYYTHTHSINVCIYSLSLGSYLKLEPVTLEELGMSALLHDLGKSRVNPNITNKKGRLTDSEFEEMKHHPLYGYTIALKIGIRDRSILDGIRHHHEKLDGSGYPDGLMGKSITLFARIIGVCDVFDALSTQRSYKDKMSSYETLRLMKISMQHHLDMELVDAFIRMQQHDAILTSL